MSRRVTKSLSIKAIDGFDFPHNRSTPQLPPKACTCNNDFYSEPNAAKTPSYSPPRPRPLRHSRPPARNTRLPFPRRKAALHHTLTSSTHHNRLLPPRIHLRPPRNRQRLPSPTGPSACRRRRRLRRSPTRRTNHIPRTRPTRRIPDSRLALAQAHAQTLCLPSRKESDSHVCALWCQGYDYAAYGCVDESR